MSAIAACLPLDVGALSAVGTKTRTVAFAAELRGTLDHFSFPTTASRDQFNKPVVFMLLVVLLAYMTLTPTPAAPALLEMFPIRAMSFPYHFASGWIGGLLPTFSFAISAQRGNIYSGLSCPVAWIAISLVIGLLFLRETKDVDLTADV
ncbi:hypothetical protein [Paraburkholderia sediminicola]|uniref:hypothetical protein n=1 Tax=Paraburkholderia sediminicola TaxID=458836 RepID=UPI0038BD26F2